MMLSSPTEIGSDALEGLLPQLPPTAYLGRDGRDATNPGATRQPWVHAEIRATPGRLDDVLAGSLHMLHDRLGADVQWWFLPLPDVSNDVLLRVHPAHQVPRERVMSVLGELARHLRHDGLARQVCFGDGPADAPAYRSEAVQSVVEAVYAADSRVAVVCRTDPAAEADRRAVAAASMFALVEGLLGSRDLAARWLCAQPATADTSSRRAVSHAVRWLLDGRFLATTPAPAQLSIAFAQRTTTLKNYASTLALDMELTSVANGVLPPLLSMSHARLHGADDRDRHSCFALARQLAAIWRVDRQFAADRTPASD